MRPLSLLSVATCFALFFSSAQASGFATYFARVTSGGTVAKSSGVADSERTTTGVYDVVFNRTIGSCAYTATVTSSVAGYATIDVKAGDTLTVTTYATNGAKANRPFSLIVTCAP